MYRKGTRTGKGSSMRLMYIGNAGYYRYMKFKQYLKLISGNQIISEKLSIINFYDKHGAKATRDAFNISRSTIYNWKKTYKDSKYNPKSLIPKSKRPKNLRRMVIDKRVVEFIKNLRENNHRLGKSKIKVLLDPYCDELNIPRISESLIGKVVKNEGMFYPKPNAHITRRKRKDKARISSRYKTTYPGELVQIDTIVKYIDGIKRYIITAVDIYSRYSFAYTYKNLSSRVALDFYQKLELCTPFEIIGVKTDNGLEFHGEFDKYLQKHSIKHFFSYPRTPKSNAYVERFNRTLQEEFVEYNIHLIDNVDEFNSKLVEYLIFFNSVRPHYGISNYTPMGYLVFKGILSSMCVTHTLICNFL